jgi:hypothetical protein
VPAALRGLHRAVSAELDTAIAATMKLPGVDVSPVTNVLDSLNARVQAVANAALQTDAGDGEAPTADATRAKSLLRNVTRHATVSHYERDETGKHLFAWPRLPRALPEVKTRTGIVHRRIESNHDQSQSSASQ